MNGLRDFFALYAIAAASLLFVAVLHLTPLFSMSNPVYVGDRLPEHVQATSFASAERHGVRARNSNVLVKPAD